MSEDITPLDDLRAAAEKAHRPDSTYADVQAMWELLGPATVIALVNAAETTYQPPEDETR